MDIFTADHLIPFTVPLVLVVILMVLELLSYAISGGAATGANGCLVDKEEDPSASNPLVAWLSLKELPLSVFLMVFFGVFGSTGLLVQYASYEVYQAEISLGLVLPLAVFVSVVLSRPFGILLRPLFAVKQTSLAAHPLTGIVPKY